MLNGAGELQNVENAFTNSVGSFASLAFLNGLNVNQFTNDSIQLPGIP